MSTNNLIEQRIVDTLEKNYMPYAMSVIVSRAIPEIDGLKPSHRKLLYTMYKMGLLTGEKTKSANVVGQTMKLNPHGDMAIYETLVRLTRGNGALLLPYVDSKGNFGKHYSRDMKYAAPRYTEVKLDKICEELFKDIDKDTVDFVDNYDGTMKEPKLLPATFPTILVNANHGIAVGMASSICSFNLVEVCNAAVEFIKDENTDLVGILKAPDFPTGGQLIYNEREMREIYEKGRGTFKLRAKYRYDKANSCIEIYEIPYTTTVEAIIDSIADLVKSNKIRDISDVRDETDLNGLKIALDIKRNADPDTLMNKLYKLTPLEDSFSCNFNILINGRPMVMGVRGILKEWVNFRMDCIKRQTLYDIDKKTQKLHILLGLEKILLDIDKAIKIIRNTEEEAMVVPNLMEGFGIDQAQAEFVAEIKLRNLNKEYILKRVSEIESLKKEIAELNELYGSEKKIKKLIIKQLEEIAKKYGQPRRTEIVMEEHIEEITHEHLIEDYNLKLFLTKQNYLKKIPLTSLRTSPEHKLKEGDFIVQELETHNKADLLLFSNRQNVYKMKIYEIEDCKASSLGEFLSNVLSLEEGEEIIHMVATDDYKGYMIFGFENGKVAKIVLESYATKTNRKKLANAYNGLSRLVYIGHILEDEELVAFSSLNKVLIFNTSNINPKTTRDSQGVQVLKSKKGSVMTHIKKISEVSFTDPDYYRTKNIPAIGCYLKDEDVEDNQIKLEL
ncbi:DNA gyrase subunit A [Acetivibrio thermocellus AD2]|jgi:DNA gyrase subunit A|uniref:DNA topoisomerase (ATP-hydrolyzing) n=1 Tax=Acetivibrio thermocellus AD2 TaxID=1138384 RepID=A0AB36TI48_ACETH|nr:DNA topoisomerase (ATP-hydrolyzing) subunit A [Acetivibrio thermocellus]ADU74971.1 DNA topoisomerase (ATP-hydrolyzing) [Acetivibrio thermocellus DSM 1313]ALX08933.1 DNA topoisomerase (ATP-hydrolyzing) [Acetivibrio thermocellus AD2]ANV76683.1 DNA topoisomerase (ATP-hydrolyzing) [Acetivibrio thermocellus DSM 2360]EIC05082.1 DNA gyrase/topoisomerase IV subunit A [Acetivibrio thermocellus YS]PFH03206.1 DNA gyrase subunit A [Acetivibrio thermocellus AD2]